MSLKLLRAKAVSLGVTSAKGAAKYKTGRGLSNAIKRFLLAARDDFVEAEVAGRTVSQAVDTDPAPFPLELAEEWGVGHYTDEDMEYDLERRFLVRYVSVLRNRFKSGWAPLLCNCLCRCWRTFEVLRTIVTSSLHKHR